MGILSFFKKFREQKEESTAPAAPSKVEAKTQDIAVKPEAKSEAKHQEKKSMTASQAIKVFPAPPPSVPIPPAPVSPLALSGSAKNQSDWLLLQIGKTGRAFIAVADKNKLTIQSAQAKSGAFVRHDMTAALLGYRLVMSAYHFHQDVPSLQALRIVRTAVTGMLYRAVDITIEQTGSKDKRQEMLAYTEEQLKSAEKQILEAASQLRGKSAEPFMSFYASLIPAFGSEDTPHALHQRFGDVLSELYAKIEAAMAARNHQITG